MAMEPLFETLALPTLERVKATFTQRGGEYGDTWRNCEFITTKAIAKEFGVNIQSLDILRSIALGILVDLKHQRLEGGWKEDSIIDGIAYSAALAEQVRITKQNHDKTQ